MALSVVAGRDTSILADYRVFVDAGRSLYGEGDPYAPNVGTFFEYHYRYPPLLAMLIPGLRWIWFPLIAGGIAVAVTLRYRARGVDGLGLPTHLTPLLVTNLFNGNVQGMILGIGALAPLGLRSAAVLLAFATWVKLYPACVVVWWLGRRDWRSLGWFGATFLALGLFQLPWMDEFIAYSVTQTGIPSQLSLRSFGVPVWVAGIAAVTYLTYTRAQTEQGWLYCIVLQIIVLPRLLLFNLPLLLMHPSVLSRPYLPLVEGSRAPLRLFCFLAAIATATTVAFMFWPS